MILRASQIGGFTQTAGLDPLTLLRSYELQSSVLSEFLLSDFTAQEVIVISNQALQDVSVGASYSSACLTFGRFYLQSTADKYDSDHSPRDGN